MSINMNDLLPAAPAGGTNVHFQRDVAGNVSAYMTTPASILAAQDLTLQTANISATTLFPTPPIGMYRVSVYIVQTQAATTSGTLPSVVVVFTDGDTSVTETLTVTTTSTANTVGTQAQGRASFYAKSTADITFSTTGYASVGATPLAYAVHIRLESL
jgi:hypothetical protein